jgi:hypothetical protein
MKRYTAQEWAEFHERERRRYESWPSRLHQWLYMRSVGPGTYQTWRGRLWEIPFAAFLFAQKKRGEWGGPVRVSWWGRPSWLAGFHRPSWM